MTIPGFPDLSQMAIEYMEGSLKFWRAFANTAPLSNNPEIKRLLDTGNVAGAQKLILAEIEKAQTEEGKL